MFLKNVSIRTKILLLPGIALLIFLALEAGNLFIKNKIQDIAQENEICHQIALEMSEMLHMESDYVDVPRENLLFRIKEKDKYIRELLKESILVIPGYSDQKSGLGIAKILEKHVQEFNQIAQLQNKATNANSLIFQNYNARNQLVQNKRDEIVHDEFETILASGTTINKARSEFEQALAELTSLDAVASLNTTELYHLGDEIQYLKKEKQLQERTKLMLKAADALSSVTENDSDREVWIQILDLQGKIQSLRKELYTIWRERQELSTNLPITDKALADFSSYIVARMKRERTSLNSFYTKFHATAILLGLLLLATSSFFILRSILIPVSKLTEGTRTFRDGETDVHIDVETNDELGELATNFNDMVRTRIAILSTLEENEEKFRRLLESTSTIPWELDLNTMQFTYVGKQAEEILGYPLSDWVDFDSWANIVHPDDREYAVNFCKSQTAQMADHDFVYRAIHQNGSIMYIEDIVSVLVKDGKPVKLVGFMHDITQQIIAEEEKTNLEERLQQAQKMEAIGTLAGGIAHDFNNLLGVILGYAEMAKEDAPKDSQLTNDMEYILQASYRARDLVQQILAFSRQTSSRLQPFQPASIVKEAIKLLRSSIPTTITIQEKINPNCDIIMADPTQLHQILMNICTNAFHAMERTGGVLAISLENKTITENDILLHPQYKPGKFVKLTIADSGPGIDPAIQDKIFDPYFTTKAIGKGTGMGLAIVHGIVNSYGGMVDFESFPGEGTTFFIYFPVAQQDEIQDEKTDEKLPTGKENILFIDDEQLLCDMGKDMLSRLGYQVTAVSKSLEALQVFESQPDQFDLVITDQTMPSMTGEVLARRMLQIRPDIPIIICTGFSTVMTKEKAESIGIRGFALKPLVKKDIAKLIRRVLEK